MPSDKMFRDMTQEEKFVCLLETAASDALGIMRYKTKTKDANTFYRYLGQHFAFEESLSLFKRMKEGKL